MSHFAARCSESELNDVLFSIKSGLFALSGDAHGESNHDFDLPDSNDSKDLVQDQLVRHACDVMLSRPRESCELILQTLLQITCQGQGY